ncbi:UNVERIFIED_CONTAM: hypothetical protein Slati_3172700 [Sesamum latifolium]|uniref:Uncharacterized protein n=1 Tax=Sesamum latifolium TaxID=2727402 RepID=A0AAW2UXN4_9LAMI
MVSETNDTVPGNFSTIPPATVTGGGLIISITDTIRSFLTAASTDSRLPEDLRDLSSSVIMHSSVPYKSLKMIWFGSQCETRPNSEELKLRLKKLEEAVERKAYEELVKDITPRKSVEEPFSSYKDQLGFGLHVVLIMFTGYLLGYAAFRALFSHSPAMSAAGGILGLVGAMLVETLLFIVRSSNQDRRSPSPTFPSSTLRMKKDQ